MVTCSFCGTANVVQPPIGSTQIRAVVRQVLAEDRAPRPAPKPQQGGAVMLVSLGAGALMLLGVFFALFLARPSVPPPVVVHVPKIVVPPVPPEPPRPHVRPPEPTVTGLGQPDALAFGDGNALFAIVGNELLKADRQTLKTVWRTKVSGGEGTIVPLAGRVVFAGPQGAFFFDAETGVATGKYLLAHDGFKVSACAAGANQVLVQTVFDGVLRFDVTTAAIAKGTASCHRMTDLHCDVGQQCGWDTSRRADLSCRYELHVKDARVTFCEVDGTKDLVLISHSGGKVRWRTPRAEGSSTNPSYASVIDGVLVTADGHVLEGFDPTTGEHQWTHAMSGNPSAVISDGQQLFVGHEGTVVVIDAKTGTDVSRFE
jgi:outer membrane protein assembly factor BamB